MTKELKVNGAELYFRDLNEGMKQEFINQWRTEKNVKLLKAVEDEEDIIIGRFGEQDLADY